MQAHPIYLLVFIKIKTFLCTMIFMVIFLSSFHNALSTLERTVYCYQLVRPKTQTRTSNQMKSNTQLQHRKRKINQNVTLCNWCFKIGHETIFSLNIFLGADASFTPLYLICITRKLFNKESSSATFVKWAKVFFVGINLYCLKSYLFTIVF